MMFSTDALLGALVLLNSKLKSSLDGSIYIITAIKFDGIPTKFKARYTRITSTTETTEGDIFFRVIGKNRITAFIQIDDNLSVE